MKAYMACSRAGGSIEGACLVFAHTVKEAKRIVWPEIDDIFCDNEYIDMSVTLLKDREFLFEYADQDKIKTDEPHVIFDPVYCKNCELWGYKLDKDGYCSDCAEEISEAKSAL